MHACAHLQVCGVPLLNHPGFKHPFMSCGPDTVVSA